MLHMMEPEVVGAGATLAQAVMNTVANEGACRLQKAAAARQGPDNLCGPWHGACLSAICP
jgi:hypothetical protein